MIVADTNLIASFWVPNDIDILVKIDRKISLLEFIRGR